MFGAPIRSEIRDFREENTRVINAMRVDLTDLRGDLTDLSTRVEDGFTQVDRRFADVDRGFMEMRGRLDAAAAGQQQVVTMLNTLIERQGEQPNEGSRPA